MKFLTYILASVWVYAFPVVTLANNNDPHWYRQAPWMDVHDVTDVTTSADCPTAQELRSYFSIRNLQRKNEDEMFDLKDTMAHESSFIFMGSYKIDDNDKGKSGALYVVFNSRHYYGFSYFKMNHALHMIRQALGQGKIKSGGKPCSYVIYEGVRGSGHEHDHSDIYAAPKVIH